MEHLFIWFASLVSTVSSIEFVLPAVGFGDDTIMNATIILSNTGFNVIDVTGGISFNDSAVLEEEFSVTIEGNSVKEVSIPSIPKQYLLNGSQIANKSYVVTSPSDTLDVHVIWGTSNHAEGVAAIPTTKLGVSYYVSSFCALGGVCQIAIATVEVGMTLVYIDLPDEVDEVAVCVGKQIWYSRDKSFHLVYPETVQFETTHDLTGTYIYSNQSVSVVVGTRSMPVSGGKLSHFYEQLTPLPHWGTKFVAQGFGTSYGSIVHITSQNDFTFVDMPGYNRTIVDKGRTLKRRVENGTVVFIEASKAIQVVMYVGISYGSFEESQSVAMTTLPAVGHFMTSRVMSCGSGYTTYQMVTDKNNTWTPPTGGHVFDVHLNEYRIIEYTEASPSPLVLSSPFSGLVLCGSALFPMAPPIKQTLNTPCTVNFARFNNGDDLDNNCHGAIDGGKCYENVKITTRFIANESANNTGTIPSYNVTIYDFYQILLRVQSCDMIQVELVSNFTSVVIHIARTTITMYNCTGECIYIGTVDTSTMTQHVDCNKVVRSYWITKAQRQLCVNIGNHNTDGYCINQPLTVDLTKSTDQIRLSGLTGDAIIWYDLYTSDCGRFLSDWRCHDVISDCYKYGTAMCTDPTYTSFVNFYCKKYCGLCTGDHHGRMFVYLPAPPELHNSSTQNLVFLGSDGESSKIGLDTATGYLDTYKLNISAHNSPPIDVAVADINGSTGTIRIFTEDDVAVAYLFGNTTDGFVLPIDVLGTEYMTISFINDSVPSDNNGLICFVESLSPDFVITVLNAYDPVLTSDAPSGSFSARSSTGESIKGNQPFAVWCGTHYLSEYGFSWYQLHPTNTWGTKYKTPLISSYITTSILAKMKIVTNSDHTEIKITGGFSGTYELPLRGDFKEFDINPETVHNIESNFPVAVAVIYYRDADKQDSSFHLLPPVASFADDPLILFGNDPIDISVSLTPTTNMTDGNVNAADEMVVNTADQPMLYTYQANNTPDTIIISYSKRGDYPPLGITQSTYLFKDFSVGRVCRLSVDGIGDDIDNDCDGNIDEELTCKTGYGVLRKDEDIDGNFGEDCASSALGTQLVTPPPFPVCLVIQTEMFGCAALCQCKCSWQQSLAEYNNMTSAEKEAYNEAASQKYKEALKVDTTKLSATVAERVSADDERTSSQNIGFVGILMIVCVISFFVVFDVIKLVYVIKTKFFTPAPQAVS